MIPSIIKMIMHSTTVEKLKYPLIITYNPKKANNVLIHPKCVVQWYPPVYLLKTRKITLYITASKKQSKINPINIINNVSTRIDIKTSILYL